MPLKEKSRQTDRQAKRNKKGQNREIECDFKEFTIND